MGDCRRRRHARRQYGDAAGTGPPWSYLARPSDQRRSCQAALELCPDGAEQPTDFVFLVPETAARRRGRGRNEEIARAQHRGESNGIF